MQSHEAEESRHAAMYLCRAIWWTFCVVHADMWAEGARQVMQTGALMQHSYNITYRTRTRKHLCTKHLMHKGTLAIIHQRSNSSMISGMIKQHQCTAPNIRNSNSRECSEANEPGGEGLQAGAMESIWTRRQPPHPRRSPAFDCSAG